MAPSHTNQQSLTAVPLPSAQHPPLLCGDLKSTPILSGLAPPALLPRKSWKSHPDASDCKAGAGTHGTAEGCQTLSVSWGNPKFCSFWHLKNIFGRWERAAMPPLQNFLLTPLRAGTVFDFMRSSRHCWDKSFSRLQICLWHYTHTLKCKGRKPEALQFSKELYFATKSSLLLV